MATILNALQRFEALDLEKVTTDSLTDTEEQLVEHNQSQMYYGEDAKGVEIGPAYKPLTVFLKTQKGQPTDRVSLYDEGDFYAGMYAKVQGNEIVFDSTDSKAAKLKRKYGEAIFGLNDPTRNNYIIKILRPEFMNKVKFTVRF
jgi:hypothetical protein